ncbi:hypothetical protein AB5I41_27975 [Sphingomonas sp. MMS24-JH45]
MSMLPLVSINAPLSRLLMPLLARERESGRTPIAKFLIACRSVMVATVPGILVAA